MQLILKNFEFIRHGVGWLFLTSQMKWGRASMTPLQESEAACQGRQLEMRSPVICLLNVDVCSYSFNKCSLESEGHRKCLLPLSSYENTYYFLSCLETLHIINTLLYPRKELFIYLFIETLNLSSQLWYERVWPDTAYCGGGDRQEEKKKKTLRHNPSHIKMTN